VPGYRRACPSASWHLLLMSVLIEAIRGYMKQKSGARDRSYIADLRPMCQVAQCHCLLGPLRRKSRDAHFLSNRGCDGSRYWLPSYTGRTNMADEWA
jgi:hypothetical protein